MKMGREAGGWLRDHSVEQRQKYDARFGSRQVLSREDVSIYKPNNLISEAYNYKTIRL